MTKLMVAIALALILTPNLNADDDNFIKEMLSRDNMKNDSQALCKKESTKRGKFNRSAYKHCERGKQIAAKGLLNKLKKWREKPWRNELLAFCGLKWTKQDITDYSMVDQCMHQQHEGILDIEYLLSQDPRMQQKYQMCGGKWGVDKAMVAYCMNGD